MFFTYQGKQIYYEIHGTGKPLLLLNGVMMSTVSWAPFVASFSQQHQVILVDLMDQGQSDAFPEGYDMAGQSAMVKALLHHLGVDSLSVLGTSYGGALALQLACDAPGLVHSLLLAATRCYTDPLFRDMLESWLHATASPQAFYTATIPLFYGATFQQQQAQWMLARRKLLEEGPFQNPDFLARMRRLVQSIMVFDLRDRLPAITCPTLVLMPGEDLVMMPWEQERIVSLIPGAQLLGLPATGHVLIQERPELFTALVLGGFSPIKSQSNS